LVASILIVDGDPDVVEAGRIVLERQGHTVITAPHVGRGIELLQKSQPDLVFLDCTLAGPAAGPLEAQAIRDGGFSVPILMLAISGQAYAIYVYQDQEMILVAGPGLDVKPMDPAALSKSVMLVLEGGEKASCVLPRASV
jgi:DNA-binding response OmpR family regulator